MKKGTKDGYFAINNDYFGNTRIFNAEKRNDFQRAN